MSKIHAVIIEDEVPAARLLHSMLCRLRPDWEITVLPGNIEDASLWFAQNSHPDLIFLDIQLADGNSFDFLEKAQPCSTIIFTTAYDEYAIRAFSVNSIDYILKPIDELRLLEAIVKYERLKTHYPLPQTDDYLPVVMDSLRQREKRYRSRFLISGADKLWTLQVTDVAYFYSENKITFAVTRQGETHVLDLSLEKLTEQLDPDRFFRANRQVLLCVDAIRRIEPHFNGKVVVLVMPDFKDKILISKEKASAFKLWLNY
ncbi:MAG: LytR/AlgR family response regulator transcription factor [Bacteroidales bacterium]